MRKLIEDLKIAAPAAFQSEDYQTRRSAIDEAFQKKQFEAFSALREKAGAKGDPAAAHPGRLRTGALSERPGRPARRIQRLA